MDTERAAAEAVKRTAEDDDKKCNKCGSTDMQERSDEIMTFREGKPYATVRALPGHKFRICNTCKNVMVKKDDVEFRILNRAERRRFASVQKKRGKK